MLCGLMTTLLNVLYEFTTTMGSGVTFRHARFDPVQGTLMMVEDGNNNGGNGKEGHGGGGIEEDEDSGPKVDWDNLDPKLVRDKGPILTLVRDAGITDVTEEAIRKLPNWADVTDLYGDKPVFHRYHEQCAKFQVSSHTF